MKLRTWNIPFVTFLSGGNTVLLKNDEEIEAFIKMMASLGIDSSVLNRRDSKFPGLLVEFNNGKGTTWWNGTKSYPTIGSAIQASTEWFGVAPFNWTDINIA